MNTASQTQQRMSPEVKRGVTRWAVRETVGVIMSALILFLCAGRWDWIWGWIAVIILAGWVVATAITVIPKNPALLAERVGPKKGAKTWDTAIMGVVGLIMLAVYVVAGLDVRNGWTVDFPIALQLVGMIAAVIGYAFVVWATSTNAYFSIIVRIQTERGHTVVTDGPYRFVRHPGYVGSILSNLGTPLLLGSWWAFGLGVVAALLMIVRTSLEDKTLQAELPGYAEYAQQTRYRLLPGMW